MTPTAPSLSVVVTSEILAAGVAAYSAKWDELADADTVSFDTLVKAALTAAFQHPEFIAQIRRQVVGCVPADRVDGRSVNDFAAGYTEGVNAERESTRASLGRLLGEEGK